MMLSYLEQNRRNIMENQVTQDGDPLLGFCEHCDERWVP